MTLRLVAEASLWAVKECERFCKNYALLVLSSTCLVPRFAHSFRNSKLDLKERTFLTWPFCQTQKDMIRGARSPGRIDLATIWDFRCFRVIVGVWFLFPVFPEMYETETPIGRWPRNRSWPPDAARLVYAFLNTVQYQTLWNLFSSLNNGCGRVFQNQNIVGNCALVCLLY